MSHLKILFKNIKKDVCKFLFSEDFKEEIDREARKFLQIVPAFDPGAGYVSPECKRDSDIFQKELNKFTLWALKSECNIYTD